MFSRLLLTLFLLGSAGAVWTAIHTGKWRAPDSMTDIFWPGDARPGSGETLEALALSALGSARQESGAPGLEKDHDLQKWLRGELGRDTPDLDAILRRAQKAFPNYTRMAVLSSLHTCA